ncbi:glycosyltransferase family 2 protein [Sphingobacteriales bacterium UPWRP_1]|nr:UDP-glucose--dolichyl-phosphate glucosyltransferase [Sphingobacteriales bacterium TSM_CSM]PSJ72651.1 glycosyltransferase family 2 protein [Sphingobacteriales bacterium UPWRP_1]
MKIFVLIPALNEAGNIARVISDIPRHLQTQVVVIDNGSADATPQTARNAGAIVLHEPVRGYGRACLRGMAYLMQLPPAQQPDVVVFIDGDYSDYPAEMPLLLQPIMLQQADMAVGSRVLGVRQKGALTPQQRFGNWLATRILRLLYGAVYTDLGPFRAIRWQTLQNLNMQDRNFGWTVEMQLKAAKAGVKAVEVPVSYRPRTWGKSKVSGTVKGTFMAGYIILRTLFKHR